MLHVLGTAATGTQLVHKPITGPETHLQAESVGVHSCLVKPLCLECAQHARRILQRCEGDKERPRRMGEGEDRRWILKPLWRRGRIGALIKAK